MTADERFKELGYDKKSDNYCALTYSMPMGYVPKGCVEELVSIDIVFYKWGHTVRKLKCFKASSYRTACTKEELTAIKLKKKEMGWE